ncbi:MAG: matrixin family metalloprotease [Pseudomonadota bacterium]
MPSFAGTKWGSLGFGNPGGVVTWSFAAPGSDISAFGDSTAVSGRSVDPDSFLTVDYERVFQDAFSEWSEVADIEFLQVNDPGNAGLADIRIFFGNIANFAGFAFFPPPNGRFAGEILIDTNDRFNLNSAFFEGLVLHEIGHAIGLDHVSGTAIMNQSIIVDTLQSDDKLGIRTLYGQQDNALSLYLMPEGVRELEILDSADEIAVIGNDLANRIFILFTNVAFVAGGGGADLLFGSTGNDTLLGGLGNDELVGSSGNDALDGGDGADRLIGGRGRDFMDGGAGIDTALYTNATAGVRADLQNLTANSGDAAGDVFVSVENLVGSRQSDVLIGDQSNNLIAGGLGNDAHFGRDGNDLFIDGGGIDLYNGGSGTDLVSFAGSARGVGVRLDGKASFGGAAGDRFTAIESVTGSRFKDTFAGNASANLFNGLGGPDNFFGGAGSDTVVFNTLSVGVGARLDGFASFGGAAGATFNSIENVTGTRLNDVLVGNAGNNLLDGFEGVDTFFGGAGTDTASYVSALRGVGVRLDGLASFGNASGDRLVSIENVTGSRFNDVLVGNAGKNVLDGFVGDDTFFGNGGSDTVSYARAAAAVGARLDGGANFGDAGGDRLVSIENLVGSRFNDVLVGNGAGNLLDGFVGDDTFFGGAGFDTVSYVRAAKAVGARLDGLASFGDAAGDRLISIENLIGSRFNDVLVGNAGINRLEGGAGNDTYFGGGGADQFVYSLGGGADRVADFADDVDTLVLSGLGFGSVASALAAARETAGDVVFDLASGGSFTVDNITKADLTDDILLG